MATTTTPLTNPVGANIVTETDLDETAANDVRAGAAIIYAVDIDNASNAAVTYAKFYNNAAPTVGTTAPDIVILVPASTRLVTVFPQGISFGTALSIAGVTTAGTAGTTGPTSAVTARIVTD